MNAGELHILSANLRVLVVDDVDVVLLDYRLPDSDDLALLGNFRRTAPDAAVVMMTAHRTAEMVEGALALGAQRVVMKPFDMHDVEAFVQHAHAARAC